MSLAHWNDIMELCVEESLGNTAAVNPVEVVAKETTNAANGGTDMDWQILVRY